MNKQYLRVLLCIIVIALLVLACDALVSQGIMGAGVTNLTNLELAGTLDVGTTLNYGEDNLYLVGHDASTEQMVFGISSITGTAVAAHGLSTVTYALCTVGEDPASGAADHLANCSVSITTNVVTVKTWENNLTTASTEVGVDVFWLVIGTP